MITTRNGSLSWKFSVKLLIWGNLGNPSYINWAFSNSRCNFTLRKANHCPQPPVPDQWLRYLVHRERQVQRTEISNSIFNPEGTDFNCNEVLTNSCLTAAAAAKSLQLCPTLCDPIDSRPPGSPVPGILQARKLEWVAISFSNAVHA